MFFYLPTFFLLKKISKLHLLVYCVVFDGLFCNPMHMSTLIKSHVYTISSDINIW